MKKKMTFYIDTSIEEKLNHWLYKMYSSTGNKYTKTAVIHMLLEALLNAPKIEPSEEIITNEQRSTEEEKRTTKGQN